LAQDRRAALFLFLFGDESGYLCISTRSAVTRKFQDTFWRLPNQLDEAFDFVTRQSVASDVWFCPTLLTRPQRVKDNVVSSTCLWADLDECHPDLLMVPPTIVLQTSPNRYQGIWKLSTTVHSSEAEKYNKRIAYTHEGQGCDKSGWDLTQLLRVPLTPNHKYVTKPKVVVETAESSRIYTLEDFSAYPALAGEEEDLDTNIMEELPDDPPENILQAYSKTLNPRAWRLMEDAPEGTWSEALWELELILFEAGMKPGEVFKITKASACNKYARDGRSDAFLWKEVARAAAAYETKHKAYVADLTQSDWTSDDISLEPLLSEMEKDWCRDNPTFIERYVEWAKTVGDAAWQYHQAGAFVILSSLLAGPVKLPTSFGTIVPNLWFMILADTTLTRKTTAMDLAIDLLVEVDSDIVLATDGSVEGLMTSLSMRPGRPSVFLRDEFSGMLEQFAKRDYYAGMMETLTKLYDGKYQKRVLRRETLEIRDPVLILFAGGIRDRVLSNLTVEHVGTGFLPRFVFITAESDVTRLRPLGPPTDNSLTGREDILSELRELYANYRTDTTIRANGDEFTLPRNTVAQLSEGAWLLYNKLEAKMLESALRSPLATLMTPTFDRLSKTGLKAAVLLAAARKLGNTVVVTEEDITRAFFYVEQWREYTLDVLANLGKSSMERVMERIYEVIRSQPGIPRAHVMRQFHLTSRDAENHFTTLEQRGLISRQRTKGTGETFHPIQSIVPITL
jgi:hypothetical protein